LPRSPAAVVVRFSAPVDRPLSQLAIVDPTGQDRGVGPLEAIAGDARSVRRRASQLGPGVYTVRWITVSTDDGHRLSGSYSFGVGTSAVPGQRVLAGAAATEGWAGLVGRGLAVVGVVLWSGAVFLFDPLRRAGLAESRVTATSRLGAALVVFGTALLVGSA